MNNLKYGTGKVKKKLYNRWLKIECMYSLDFWTATVHCVSLHTFNAYNSEIA